MNEKIKQLMQKSSSAVGYIGNWGRVQWADDVYPQVGDDLYAGVDLEKFTQLIVRECLEQIDKIRDGLEADNEDQQALGADWAGLAVARHFGVE